MLDQIQLKEHTRKALENNLEMFNQLCLACNTVLGKVKDDLKILRRMIDYLKQKG